VSKLSDEIKQCIIKKLEIIEYTNMYNFEEENKMTFGKGYDMNFVNAQTYHVHIHEKRNIPQDEFFPVTICIKILPLVMSTQS